MIDLPGSLVQRIASTTSAHAELERSTAQFAGASGIACPSGCGRCCLSPEVESTVADLLPLAAELVARGEAAAVLERIAGAGDDRRCVLFAPEQAAPDAPGSDDPGRGRCTMYAWRPSLCRLFGFSGRRDRSGRIELVACRVHRTQDPQRVEALCDAVARGDIALPILDDSARWSSGASPSDPLRPINEALARAVQQVALAARLCAADEDGAPQGDGSRPRPRQAA